jgi:hypothetical protein
MVAAVVRCDEHLAQTKHQYFWGYYRIPSHYGLAQLYASIYLLKHVIYIMHAMALEGYTFEQLTQLLDNNEPPPAPLTRKLIREARDTLVHDEREQAMASARWVCNVLMPWSRERQQLVAQGRSCATAWRLITL